MRAWVTGFSGAVLVSAVWAAPAIATTQRDARDYALSACLIEQPNDYLRDQGFGLGAIVVERGGGRIDRWVPLRAAVKAELARRPMTTIHGDGPVGVEKAMPVARCLAVLDAPKVRAAMARVARQ